MAADVSSFAQREEGEGKRELVTRDLLGGVEVSLKSAEVDLELRVPDGWERRLDLVSGKTYLQKSEPHPAHRHHPNLNLALPPPSFLALFPEVNAGVPPSGYQSVCTLEKVRYALQRAGHRPNDFPLTPSSPSTGVDCSAKRRAAPSAGDRELNEPSPAISRCPGCLLYALVSSARRRCPRCTAHLAVDGEAKKRLKLIN